MRARHDLINSIKEDVIQALKQKLSDGQAYQELLRKLVVQGMIKLMQKNVRVKSLSRDLQLIAKMKGAAEREFEDIISQQTGLKVKSSMEACQDYSLDDEGVNDLGGVVLTCHAGLIYCKSTIESRIEMAFEDCLPAIREGLFS